MPALRGMHGIGAVERLCLQYFGEGCMVIAKGKPMSLGKGSHKIGIAL